MKERVNRLDRSQTHIGPTRPKFNTDDPKLLPNRMLLDPKTGALVNEIGKDVGYLQPQEMTLLEISMEEVLSTKIVIEEWYAKTGEKLAPGTIYSMRSRLRKIFGLEFKTPKGEKVKEAKRIRVNEPDISRRKLKKMLKKLGR